jgi:hypothetical protein
VDALETENAGLRAANAGLQAENAELRRRPGMNSGNSSIPPSNDNGSQAAKKRVNLCEGTVL